MKPTMSLLILVLSAFTLVFAQDRMLEPRHSFKPPFFLIRGAYLPNWEFTGSAVVTEDYVRLTPAIKSRTGSLWNTEPLQMIAWELEMEFRIGGGGKLGADGMALWYVSETRQEGNVFGMRDEWRGMAIIFDTFDNDGMRDNPQIVAVYNDGTKQWREDGKSIQFGGCHSQFRNPYKNVKAKVRNVDGFVEVLLDTAGNGIWEPCVPPTRLNLPTGYFLGVTAATGGLFDNHDVYSLETFNLDMQMNDWRYQQQMQQRQLEQQELQQLQQQQQEQQQQAQDQEQEQDPNQAPNAFEDVLTKLNAPAIQDSAQSSQNTQQPMMPPPQNTQQQIPNAPQQTQNQQQQQQQPQQTQQQKPAGTQYSQPSSTELKDVLEELTSINSKLQLLQNRPDSTDFRQQLDAVKLQQQNIVEAITTLLKNVATKADLDDIKRKVDSVSSTKDQMDIKSLIADLKASVSTKVGSRNEDIVRAIEEVNQNLKSLKASEEQTQRSTRQIAENLQQNAQDLTQTIHQSTTFGFWSYFMFVQAIFIFGYVWWRKHREDANKKLI